MDRHKKQIIDVWEKLNKGERHYLLKLRNDYFKQRVTLALLPLVEIAPLLALIQLSAKTVGRKDARYRFLIKLYRKLT